MRRRCKTCGARLDEDDTCPACDLDLLTVTDHDAGIRHEDRYVALPPGPRWVPRRVRRESSRAPLVILGIVLAVLALVSALRGDAPDRVVPATPPLLDEATGTTLVRAGPHGLERIDVDEGRIGTLDTPDVSIGRVRQLVTVPDGMVALTGPGAFLLDGEAATWLGNADALVPSPDGVRLVSYPRPGEILVTPPGTTLELGDDRGREIVGEVVATLSAHQVLVQRSRDDGEPLLAIHDQIGGRILASGETFVAASGDTLVTRPHCPDATCPSLRIRGPNGTRDLEDTPGNPVVVALAPDATRLAVLAADRSVIVDLAEDAVHEVAPGSTPTDEVTWSRDGRWLFAITADGGIDAIRDDGARFRVPVAARSTEALAVL